jgi:hypothetical protein
MSQDSFFEPDTNGRALDRGGSTEADEEPRDDSAGESGRTPSSSVVSMAIRVVVQEYFVDMIEDTNEGLDGSS